MQSSGREILEEGSFLNEEGSIIAPRPLRSRNLHSATAGYWRTGGRNSRRGMGKKKRPRRPAEAPLEAAGVEDAQGVAVGQMWRPRRPAEAPLKEVGVKDAKGDPVVAAARGGEKGQLEDEGIAVCRMGPLDWAPVVIATTRREPAGVKDANGVAVGKMSRPRRPAKVPLEAVGVGVKDAEGVAVIPVDGKVAAAKGGQKGPMEDGIAVCRMGAPVVVARTRQEAVGVKDAKGVALGKMWRPRRPAKAPLLAAGVKDAEGVAVIAVDGKVEASGAPVVAATGGGEKGSLDEEIAVCHMNTLDGAPVTTRREVVGVKDANGVAVGKIRRPAKVPLQALAVKDTKGVAVIPVDGKVEASGAPVVVAAGGDEKGPAVCRMGAPVVVARTRQEAVGVKDAKGVALGKMWRPRRPAKAPLLAAGVKDAEGVAVIAVDVKVEASGAPVVAATGGGEKGPLDEEIAVCHMNTLDGAPVMTRREVVGVKDANGVAVGKIRRPRRPAKVPLQALAVKDTKGVAVIPVDGKVEASGAPVVVAAGGDEKGPLEEGIMVCQVDALDGAPVIAMPQQEAVGVKDAEEVAVGKMLLPGRPAKAPLEVLGVKDVEGVAVIAVDGEVEPLVLGVPVVAAAGGGEKGSQEDGIMVCQVDALNGAPVIAITQQEALGVKDAEGVAVIAGEVEPLVLGVPVVVAASGGEKGPLEDGIVVCRMDTFNGAPVITIDEKEKVSVQGDPVFPAVDQEVDAPVVEAITVEGNGKVEKDEEAITVKENGKEEKDEEAITVKENGKEEKDEEGIKWLKHYSTAQSILIVGDGDFSFSLALATAFGSGGNLVATSLDSYGLLTIKYGKAESNIRELKRLGATVLHDVDAKTMKLHSYLEMRRFDRIVFNFPHAGFNGRERWLHVIRAHKQLVHAFLANARQLLRPNGEIHLSHKTGDPYDAWDIEQLAYESCLVMVQKVDFCRDDYPGYNQKKGDGVTCDESFPLGRCCTYMFCVGDVEKLKQAHENRKKLKQAHGNRKKLKQKQAHGNRVGSISSWLGDSEFYPGISATDMMWPYNLHPAWPQPHFPPVHLPIPFDPRPFGVAGMEHPVNCYGTSFYHQDMVQPTHQVQPWYQERPPIGPPWTPQEHRVSKGSTKFTGN